MLAWLNECGVTCCVATSTAHTHAASYLENGGILSYFAFIIGGEVYDEIYISVYENTMINGKPYSLPMAEPVYNITQDDFAEACFSKGEGWHCLTAAEWGLLANLSLKNGTLVFSNYELNQIVSNGFTARPYELRVYLFDPEQPKDHYEGLRKQI